MRFLLIALSLIGLVGCGSKVDFETQEADVEDQKVDVEAQEVDVEAQLAALQKSGATLLRRHSDGKVFAVQGRRGSKLDIQQLRGLTDVTTLNVDSTKVTDADLEHLKGLTKLENRHNASQ